MDFTPDLIEIWTLYGVGTLMIAARIFVRTKLVGVRGYSPDDYLIWLAWLVYSNVTAMAHVFIAVAQGKHTSMLTPAQRENMPVSERPSWEFGSQIFLAGFFSYAIIVWTLKFNMLFFYRRLVRGTTVERAVIPALAFVGVTGVAVVLTFTLMCIPFHKLWQVYPDPKGVCVPQNGVIFYTVLVLNLITDLFIILIPIPVVLPMKTSVPRKIGLCILFGLGAFVMICAIVRIVLVFRLNQQGVSAMWSIREDFVAVFVGQAPIVYSMTKPTFWRTLYSTGTHSSSGANNTSRKNKNESYQMNGMSNDKNKKPKDPYSVTQIGLTMIDKSESQEEIIKRAEDDSGSERKEENEVGNGGIMVKRTYNVETQSVHVDEPESEQYDHSRTERTVYRGSP